MSTSKITDEEIEKGLPDFLYERDGEIFIGYHGDSICTDEWNKWLRDKTK